MARRKANDLENQMSLMDMMASESPEYTEEGPEELLDPSEDTGDSDGQTDKPFKLVANKTTKAKASISTQALSVVKAVCGRMLTCSGIVISYNCQSKDEAMGTVIGLYGGRRF